jgi:hypothetical protein
MDSIWVRIWEYDVWTLIRGVYTVMIFILLERPLDERSGIVQAFHIPRVNTNGKLAILNLSRQ